MKSVFAILMLGAFLALGSGISAQEPMAEFSNPRIDYFWIAIDPSGDTIPGMNGGQPVNQPGEDGIWRFYLDPLPTGGFVPWFNIWFYNDPPDLERMKRVRMGFYIQPINPGLPASVFYVINWSTPEWTGPGYPMPEDEEFIMRSETIGPIPVPPVFPPAPPLWLEFFYEILPYNPEWISVDIFGTNIQILMEPVAPPQESPLYPWFMQSPGPGGIIVHECLAPTEFGDAPEGDTCYIDPVIIGKFPTCTQVGPPQSHIVHGCPSWLFFGAFVDGENDGNAGYCPAFGPNLFNMDECGTFPYPIPPVAPPGPVDEGLIIPTPYTLGLLKPAFWGYFPCGAQLEQPLGNRCQPAVWGQNIDIWLNGVNPQMAGPGFFNLLIDWNKDGDWLDAPICDNNPVPEHVVINFPIPPNFIGPISQLNLPNFLIGPTKGYVWCRFTLTEQPVNLPWDGSGTFADGETEDYIVRVIGPSAIPVSNWPLYMALGLIILFTSFLYWKRK